MRYWMYKVNDDQEVIGNGDSGGMSDVVFSEYWDDKTKEPKLEIESDARPRVGVIMRVGSVYARSFQHQDWWQTSRVVKIKEEATDTVLFETETGSTYLWKHWV